MRGELALALDEIDSILELAELESSRWPRRATNLTDVAYVLATAFPEQFEMRFGSTGRILLERLLAGRRSCGSLARARALLSAAHSIDDAIRLFHEFLAFPDILTREVEMETVERNLVSEIEDRFVSYRHTPDSVVLDQLYVLIGTLKIVKLTEAHEATKKTLMTLRP